MPVCISIWKTEAWPSAWKADITKNGFYMPAEMLRCFSRFPLSVCGVSLPRNRDSISPGCFPPQTCCRIPRNASNPVSYTHLYTERRRGNGKPKEKYPNEVLRYGRRKAADRREDEAASHKAVRGTMYPAVWTEHCRRCLQTR